MAKYIYLNRIAKDDPIIHLQRQQRHPDKDHKTIHDLVFLSRARRGCDQYVCPCPGQLINPSQLLGWKTSYPHIRSAALCIYCHQFHPKISTSSAFGCAEDQFRGKRHWRISNQQLPYSETNKSMWPSSKYKIAQTLSCLLLIRKERSERARRSALVMRCWHLTNQQPPRFFFRATLIAAPKFTVTWAHIHDLLLFPPSPQHFSSHIWVNEQNQIMSNLLNLHIICWIENLAPKIWPKNFNKKTWPKKISQKFENESLIQKI